MTAYALFLKLYAYITVIGSLKSWVVKMKSAKNENRGQELSSAL